MKRLVCLALLVMLCIPAPMGFAEEESQVFTSGNYQYILLPGGGAEITKYTGYDGELIVPAQLDGHPVQRIGDNSFVNHPELINIILPEGLLSIGGGAFNLCTSLTSVTLPKSLQSIEAYAFYCCPLTSVTLPKSLQSIEAYAFYCCPLASVTLPEGLLSIGDGAFFGCDLSSVTLPDSIREMGANPFVSCVNLTQIYVSMEHPYLATIQGVLFSKPDKRLICYPAGLNAETYTVPKGIKIIGDRAFYLCRALSAVALPEGVQSIGYQAFYECNSLASIALPEGLQSIGERAFYRCTSLSSITLPEGLQSIGDDAFAGAPLSSITLPDSIREMGKYPFSIKDLNQIQVSPDHPYLEISQGVLFSKPDKRLIYYPAGLNAETYTVPKGIKIIEEEAFFGCTSLSSITLPEGLQSIGDYAFAGVPLSSIALPEGLQSIGERAFHQCTSLSSITLPEGLQSIGDYAFYQCESLVSVILPDGLQSVGEGTFYYCKSLTSITLPEGVQTIGENAFYCCDNLELTVVQDSYAHRWAKENGYTYIFLDSYDWLSE